MIQATYKNSSQFTLTGDFRDYVRVGSVVAVDQGVDGNMETYITACEYFPADDITLYTIESTGLTVNLRSLKRGHTYVDPLNQSSNLSRHDHSEDFQGGKAAFSGFTNTEKVGILNHLATLSSVSSNKILSVDDLGESIVKRSIGGTPNQVDVTVTENSFVLSAPQDLSPQSAPSFQSICLQDGSGVLLADPFFNGRVVTLNSETPLAVLRKTERGDGFELRRLNLTELGDFKGRPSHGQSIFYNEPKQCWEPRDAGEGGGGDPSTESGGVSLATVVALISFFSD